MFGFSLGGNHVLRYTGAAKKNLLMKQPESNDQSDAVKGVVTISAPFDSLTTSIKLKKTFFGLLDLYLGYKLM